MQIHDSFYQRGYETRKRSIRQNKPKVIFKVDRGSGAGKRVAIRILYCQADDRLDGERP